MIAKKPPKKWKEIGGTEESQDKKKKKKDYSFQLPVRRVLIHLISWSTLMITMMRAKMKMIMKIHFKV